MGAWEELPGGSAALRLSIRSPDAGSHMVVFRSGYTSHTEWAAAYMRAWLPANMRSQMLRAETV